MKNTKHEKGSWAYTRNQNSIYVGELHCKRVALEFKRIHIMETQYKKKNLG